MENELTFDKGYYRVVYDFFFRYKYFSILINMSNENLCAELLVRLQGGRL